MLGTGCRTLFLIMLSLALVGCQTTGITYPNTNRADAEHVIAYLAKPEGDGPFPAVMLLHGCSGLEKSGAYMAWRGIRTHASALNKAGFVTLIVDSHGTRGYTLEWSWRNSCGAGRNVPDRFLDVTGAIRYLESLPYVKPGVGAVGFSQGAGVVLGALGWKPSSIRKSVLAAGVAFYPPCVGGPRLVPPKYQYAPSLILIGDADNWTPSSQCETLIERMTFRSTNRKVDDDSLPVYVPEIVVYPGAHHSFDKPWTRLVRTPIGTTMASDPGATRDARTRMIAFFKAHLGQRASARASLP